jgi:non-specific serine/threonine protein kinase
VAGLPGELTGFVGRRAETAQVRQLLTVSRLVTLTGPGGVGKTRLSLQVARGLKRAFPDGISFVDLATLDDPALVPHAIAVALELPDTSGQDVTALLEARLADARPLIVLDNCEHLVAAAGALVSRLLSHAAGLRFLVTSREPLGITGEHVLPVTPLSVPGRHQPETGEAMALFAERASAVVPGFALGPGNLDVVARLCRRLDGLPLAIELAAARLRVLSPEQILDRLEEPHSVLDRGRLSAPARHQTLGTAIHWSFDLCTELERTLWARLSVFPGGFELEAAERVGAGTGVDAHDVLDGVAGLVEKSVLAAEHTAGRARYRMLETIRAFGRQRLREGGEEVIARRRHRDYYLELAQRAEEEWFGPRQADWLERFDRDRADVWAALGFCLADPSELDRGVDLAGSLWWFWITRAVRDGRQWLDRVVAASADRMTKARRVDGWLALAHGDAPDAVRLLGGPPDGVAILAQAVVTGTPDPVSALAWCNLPTVAGLLGEPDQAVELCRGWSAICETAGERWARSWAQWVLAVAQWRRSGVPEAAEHAKEALRCKRSLGDQLGIPPAVGLVAALQSDAKRAAFLFGASEKMWEPVGPPVFGWGTFRDWCDQWRAHTRDTLGAEAFDSAAAAGRRADLRTALAYALGEKAETAAAPPAKTAPRLTRRELEVANLIAEGRSNREIAAALVISQRTAETHVENILSKLGFTSRTQVAVWVSRR